MKKTMANKYHFPYYLQGLRDKSISVHIATAFINTALFNSINIANTSKKFVLKPSPLPFTKR